MGRFTGLLLNLEKTIAFDPRAERKLFEAGVAVRNQLVKYLGAFLGLGDLLKQNFEKSLRVAKSVIS